MKKFRYDTYCGLYCGACDILMEYKKGLENNCNPDWDNINFPFKKLVDKYEIKCHGCKTDTVFPNCQNCIIRKCKLIQSNTYENCSQCMKYPCFRYTVTKIMKKILRIEKKMPHHNKIEKNLMRLKEIGIDKWIDEQKQLWSCPKCKTPFSWYQEKCKKCGYELDSIKDYNLL